MLDTIILIPYLRGNNPTRDFVDEYYEPFGIQNEAIISVVTVGEIKSIAIMNNWGSIRIKRVEEALKQVIVADINTEDIINRYSEIDAFSQGRLESKKAVFSARNMGKNDLWIAATASVLEATLLTTDNDFDHLQGEFVKVGKIGLIDG